MARGFTFALAGTYLLALGACTTGGKLDAAKSVSGACAALAPLDLTFRVFAPQIGVTNEQMKWEQGFIATAQAACDNRGAGWEKVVESALLEISDFLSNNGVKAAPMQVVSP